MGIEVFERVKYPVLGGFPSIRNGSLGFFDSGMDCVVGSDFGCIWAAHRAGSPKNRARIKVKVRRVVVCVIRMVIRALRRAVVDIEKTVRNSNRSGALT